MVNPTKANQREKEIDVARCKGNWDAIPELARKFRKHSASGIVLEQTALAEYALVKAIEKTEAEKGFREESYDDDSPNNITFPPTVEESSADDIFAKLEVALSQASGQEKEYVSIILARAYYVIGRYDKCAEALSTEFVPQNLPSGYNFVLIIQALTVGGMAREMLEDNDGAIACYDQVVILLAQKSGEKSEQLARWSEEALYRSSLLKVRLGNASDALQSFRTYQTYVALWGEKFCLHKRVIIFKNFIKILSKSYQEGTYVPPSSSAPMSDKSSVYTPYTFRVELTGLHYSYENVLYQITPFPKAGESNWRVLEFVDQVISDWALLNRGTTVEMKGLIDMLYRATHKTFQSPRILRHLLNTLIAYGDYEEAELAINAYVSIVEKVRETSKDEIENASKKTSSKKYTDVESTKHVVQTLIVGSELMAKYLNKAKETLDFAQRAISWCEDEDGGVDNELLAHAWRCMGVGYNLMAREERDPECRSRLHTSAIDALTKSTSFDSNVIETHYLLALEHAITRDINQANISIRQAL
ncbi:5734_t:CDS:10, partial [Acaulospora morrowiae]